MSLVHASCVFYSNISGSVSAELNIDDIREVNIRAPFTLDEDKVFVMFRPNTVFAAQIDDILSSCVLVCESCAHRSERCPMTSSLVEAPKGVLSCPNHQPDVRRLYHELNDELPNLS